MTVPDVCLDYYAVRDDAALAAWCDAEFEARRRETLDGAMWIVRMVFEIMYIVFVR